MKTKDPNVSQLASELIAASERMTKQRRAMLKRYTANVFPDEAQQLIEELIPLPPAGMARQLNADLRKAVKAGFVLALGMYSRELKQNAEALAIIEARRRGADNGHASASRRREDQACRIRETWAKLEAVGQKPTNASVAAAVNCSVSTVIRAFRDRRK